MSLKKNIFNRVIRDDRGAAMIYTAILLPALIGFVGLGVDISLWELKQREARNIADAAALAGALEIVRVKEDPDYSAAATLDAIENGYFAATGNSITINKPPSSGPYTHITNAVEVIVQMEGRALFSSVVGVDNPTIGARSVALGAYNSTCLWALNETDPSVIDVNGSASVNFTCGVFANSSDAEAINVSGGGCLTGTEVKVVGGALGDCVTPLAQEGELPKSDPLADLPAPTSTGCTYSANTTVAGGVDATLNPGTYCGNINIVTSGTVTLNPGVYILDGSGLNISGQSTVVGEGVTIYLKPGGQVSDNITISGGSVVELTAPDSGPYAGILIYQDRNSSNAITHSLTGGALMDLGGILYFPTQSINFAGGSVADSSNSTIISDKVTFTGNSYLAEFEASERLLNPLLVQVKLME